MKIYKTRTFVRWAKKEHISDAALLQAIEELKAGLHDGDLGHHLFKKRVRKLGRGKRGSYRTIIAMKFNHGTFFMFGYAKNEKSTLSKTESETLKIFAQSWLNMTVQEINRAIKRGELFEVI